MSDELRAMDPDTVRATQIVESLCEDFGVTFEDAHAALADISYVLQRMPGQERQDILQALEDGDFPEEEPDED